jgi:5'-3' exonuclease
LEEQILVHLYRPIASILVTPENVDELLGFHVDHYTLYKALVGKTREVDGIPGIGEKTAKQILSGFEYSVDCLLQIANGHGNNKIRAIYEHKEELLAGIELSDIFRENLGHESKQELRSRLSYSLKRDWNAVGTHTLFRQALDLVTELEMQSITSEWSEWEGTFKRMIDRRR